MNRELHRMIRAHAEERCEYCHMPTAYDPLPFQLDHIIAQQHGGKTVFENLGKIEVERNALHKACKTALPKNTKYRRHGPLLHFRFEFVD